MNQFKQTIITDAVSNALTTHKINLHDFACDISGTHADAGSTIRIPVIKSVGTATDAKGDGTDDFSASSKTIEKHDVEMTLKYVTAPLSVSELESGAALSDFAEALANAAVAGIQRDLEDVISSSQESITIDSETFTASTLTKTIRPKVRKAGAPEPVVYLTSDLYASVIPMDKDGFDPAVPHFGFSKIAEFSPVEFEIKGFAASKNAVAIATRIPNSLAQNPAYTTKYVVELPEVGVQMLYCEWSNPNNGTQTAGLFWLQGLDVIDTKGVCTLL